MVNVVKQTKSQAKSIKHLTHTTVIFNVQLIDHGIECTLVCQFNQYFNIFMRRFEFINFLNRQQIIISLIYYWLIYRFVNESMVLHINVNEKTARMYPKPTFKQDQRNKK